MISLIAGELERELTELIINVCNITDVQPDDLHPNIPLIGPDSPLGLDSLDAVEIVAAIQKNYNIRIDAQETSRVVLKSIRTLADFIKSQNSSS